MELWNVLDWNLGRCSVKHISALSHLGLTMSWVQNITSARQNPNHFYWSLSLLRWFPLSSSHHVFSHCTVGTQIYESKSQKDRKAKMTLVLLLSRWAQILTLRCFWKMGPRSGLVSSKSKHYRLAMLIRDWKVQPYQAPLLILSKKGTKKKWRFRQIQFNPMLDIMELSNNSTRLWKSLPAPPLYTVCLHVKSVFCFLLTVFQRKISSQCSDTVRCCIFFEASSNPTLDVFSGLGMGVLAALLG